MPADAGAGKAPLQIYPNYMRQAPRQRSLADMANEQLNGNRSRDKFAESMSAAEKPDCLTPPAGPLGGLMAAPVIAANIAQGKCK